jgi:FOG: Transposase
MSTSVTWEHELQTWLEPFLAHLHHPARRRMCPLYVAGLIGPGERKSLQPIAARVAPVDYDQLHHFVAVSPWDEGPLEAELLAQANRLVGGSDAILVIDDTALPKKGTALGRGGLPICRRAGQEHQLSDPGLASP